MGLGRRTFAPGEVLTASNVMNYLMDQSVMNFAGTAARGSAIGTAVSEGMVSYINDTDKLEVYRAIGTASPAWSPVAFPGDTGIPFTMAAGTVSQTTNTAYQNTFYSIATFTFPASRFSVAPIMVANVGGGGYGWASTTNVSASGFQCWLIADTNGATRTIHYHAIQMTSTTAAG